MMFFQEYLFIFIKTNDDSLLVGTFEKFWFEEGFENTFKGLR